MELEKIFSYTNKDFKYVCERLKEIRLELKKEHAAANQQNPYSRQNIADALGVTSYTITNLESSSFTHNSIKMIHLYYSHGYNPNWMLIEDNDFINKKILQENLIVKANVHEGFKKMQETVTTAINEYKETL